MLPNAGQWTQPDGSIKSPDGMNLNNPCQAAILSHDIFFNQKTNPYQGKSLWGFGSNPTCYGQPNGYGLSKNDAPMETPVEKTGKQADWDGPDKTCNWDGPFCHTDNRGGRIWNGGGNPSYQGSPWPCYGYAQFLKQTGDIAKADVSPECSDDEGSKCSYEECEKLRILSEKIAEGICDKVIAKK